MVEQDNIQLNLNKYSQKRNWAQIVNSNIQQNRFNPFKAAKTHRFLKLSDVSLNFQFDRPKTVLTNSTYDWGKTFDNTPEEILYSYEYFLSSSQTYISYQLYTLIDLLSSFGGLFSTLIFVGRVIGTQINTQNLMAKYIKSLYFIDEQEFTDFEENSKKGKKGRKGSFKSFKDTESHTHKTIQFSFMDRFACLKAICRKKTTA